MLFFMLLCLEADMQCASYLPTRYLNVLFRWRLFIPRKKSRRTGGILWPFDDKCFWSGPYHVWLFSHLQSLPIHLCHCNQGNQDLIDYFFKKNGPPQASFSFILGLFKKLQFLQQINANNIHPLYDAGIRTHDLLTWVISHNHGSCRPFIDYLGKVLKKCCVMMTPNWR